MDSIKPAASKALSVSVISSNSMWVWSWISAPRVDSVKPIARTMEASRPLSLTFRIASEKSSFYTGRFAAARRKKCLLLPTPTRSAGYFFRSPRRRQDNVAAIRWRAAWHCLPACCCGHASRRMSILPSVEQDGSVFAPANDNIHFVKAVRYRRRCKFRRLIFVDPADEKAPRQYLPDALDSRSDR